MTIYDDSPGEFQQFLLKFKFLYNFGRVGTGDILHFTFFLVITRCIIFVKKTTKIYEKYCARVVSMTIVSNWLWNRKQPLSGASRCMPGRNMRSPKPVANAWWLI